MKPWASSGWNNNKNVRMMLDFLVQRGEVAVTGGKGRDRLWGLASRVHPDDPAPPSEEARRLHDQRRLSALGIARSRGPECPVEPLDVGEAGEPAVVEGVRGQWRVEFDYHLEMYKPTTKRRWGYYAFPILYGDRLVGKLDARADRKAGVLRVAAVHRDVPFSNAMTAAVDREIRDLARWLDLELVLPD